MKHGDIILYLSIYNVRMNVDCEVTDKIENNKYITAVWDMFIRSMTFFFYFPRPMQYTWLGMTYKKANTYKQ